jgi:hypothetical protein
MDSPGGNEATFFCILRSRYRHELPDFPALNWIIRVAKIKETIKNRVIANVGAGAPLGLDCWDKTDRCTEDNGDYLFIYNAQIKIPNHISDTDCSDTSLLSLSLNSNQTILCQGLPTTSKFTAIFVYGSDVVERI